MENNQVIGREIDINNTEAVRVLALSDWVADNFNNQMFKDGRVMTTLAKAALKSAMPFLSEHSTVEAAINAYIESKPKEIARWGLMNGTHVIKQDLRPLVLESTTWNKTVDSAMAEDEWTVIFGGWTGKQLDLKVDNIESLGGKFHDFEEIPMAFALEIQRDYDSSRFGTNNDLSAFNERVAERFAQDTNSPR